MLSLQRLITQSVNFLPRNAVQRQIIVSPFNFTQTMGLKKIPNSRLKRQPMTTKRAGKGFYKGNRSRKEGFIDSKGNLTYLILNS
jgi:hypothetical protein